MTARRTVHNASGSPKEREAKLLLVGHDDEFEGNVTRRILDATTPWVTSRSASLLGALARLQSQNIDLVLLSHKFRDEELELFVADARRNGFQGLILRIATMKSAGSDPSGDSPSGFTPPRELMDDPMHPMRIAQSVRQPKRTVEPFHFVFAKATSCLGAGLGWNDEPTGCRPVEVFGRSRQGYPAGAVPQTRSQEKVADCPCGVREGFDRYP